MRRSVLIFVIFAVFTTVVLAARKPEQKLPSQGNEKGTSHKESSLESAPTKKQLKKEPTAKKPHQNKKPQISQKNEEELFEEEEAFVEEKPLPAKKNPANKKKPIADSSIPQPPRRGQKPPTPTKLKPDYVDFDPAFELPKPPSPPNV